MATTVQMIRDMSNLDKFTVVQLKSFLKVRNVRSSGKKAVLLDLAKLYFDSPVISQFKKTERCTLFSEPTLLWQEVTAGAKLDLPGFSIVTISSYLSTLPVTMTRAFLDEGEGADEEVEAGTEKPAAKGRRMYCSEKMTYAEWCSKDGQTFFRGNCDASLRKACRYPAVGVTKDGEIIKGTAR
jgi:hypothetical protein